MSADGATKTGVESSIGVPGEVLKLYQNYPNPFNPSTTIRFYLRESAPVSMTIYSALGSRVSQVLSSHLDAGEHSVVWDASQVRAGMYVCRVRAGDQVRSIRLLLVR